MQFEPEIENNTHLIWAQWAGMPDHCADPIGAAQHLVADPRARLMPQEGLDLLYRLVAELRVWAPSSRAAREFHTKITNLVGGLVVYGHDQSGFRAYCAINGLKV